ncbi:MAG: MaoC/PaaZ C-terminal domain-containing protein [Acidimicrobiia bacterium]|nr:MaoC/PaaZ C-terminal domain-containing protein [Acidimicrobiia bacterium]
MGALAADSFGPVSHTVTPQGVAAFVAATGDDAERWSDHAPPSYAAVGLLTVAGQLLTAAMDDFAAIVHTKQRFSWEGPLPLGSEIEVSGMVSSSRERSGMTMVEFSAAAPGWMKSTSSFLMSGAVSDRADELAEPPPATRTTADVPLAAALPAAAGEAVAPLAKSASRLDILQYAAASGDWNPIHWDHESAAAVGLGGVVAHGLLAAAWLAQAAARYSPRTDPLASIDIRFRHPLRPGAAATVTGTARELSPLRFDLSLMVGGDALVTATAEVNE